MQSSCVFPPFLPDGGRIGVVSPSKWAEPAWIDTLEARLRARGYDVVVHPQNKLRVGWLAGSDEARAAALMEMLADPAIDAVMCARGGTGALRLLDRLNYDVLRGAPKSFIGFSDATCLVNAFARRAGVVAYHGPMGWSFSDPQFDSRTLDDFLGVVSGRTKELSFPQARVLEPGTARGVLFGGNISLLQTLVGTPYAFRPENGILFIEDVEEPLYKLDRALTHLRLAGLFEGVRAVIVGEMTAIEDPVPVPGEPPEAWYGKGVEDIVRDHVPCGVPIVCDVPCGHGKYLTTFPVGAEVEVSCTPSFFAPPNKPTHSRHCEPCAAGRGNPVPDSPSAAQTDTTGLDCRVGHSGLLAMTERRGAWEPSSGLTLRIAS